MRGCQLCRQASGGVALGYLRRCILSRFCELLCCFVGQLAACVLLSAETTIITIGLTGTAPRRVPTLPKGEREVLH